MRRIDQAMLLLIVGTATKDPGPSLPTWLRAVAVLGGFACVMWGAVIWARELWRDG